MLNSKAAAFALALAIGGPALSAQRPQPVPDLQGIWTNGTVTPLQRPADLAGKPVFSEAEATEYEREAV